MNIYTIFITYFWKAHFETNPSPIILTILRRQRTTENQQSVSTRRQSSAPSPFASSSRIRDQQRSPRGHEQSTPCNHPVEIVFLGILLVRQKQRKEERENRNLASLGALAAPNRKDERKRGREKKLDRADKWPLNSSRNKIPWIRSRNGGDQGMGHVIVHLPVGLDYHSGNHGPRVHAWRFLRVLLRTPCIRDQKGLKFQASSASTKLTPCERANSLCELDEFVADTPFFFFSANRGRNVASFLCTEGVTLRLGDIFELFKAIVHERSFRVSC